MRAILLICGLLAGCQDTGSPLPPPSPAVAESDIARLNQYAQLAEQYLASGSYHIEYADLPPTIYGQAWRTHAQVNTALINDSWELARTTVHELCHTNQYNRGALGNFDWVSPYEDRWQEIECKSIELDGAKYIYASLTLEPPAIPQNWEDYYFHTKLLTEFSGKAHIRYYPETYVTTWLADSKACFPYTFTQE